VAHPTPSVSVIIPMRDAAATVGQTLEALGKQDLDVPFEVIVADNGSTDGSQDMALGYTPAVPGLRVVDASGRPGAAFARNVGASAAAAPLLAFCDADDIPEPGWLRNLLDASRGQHAVGGRLAYDRLNPTLDRSTHGRLQEAGLARPMGYLPFSSTANLLVPARAFADVGGFDEEHFRSASSEDIDLCWRLQEAGLPLRFTPHAVVQYRLRGNRRDHLRRLFHYAVSDPLVYRRHAAFGARRRRPRGVLWGWAQLVLTWPTCVTRSGRDRWTRRLAKQVGWLVGSIRHRVIYL
jgi:glycosyltransferase involved in cell wall biosynthesis